MSLRRYNPRRDANEGGLVKALEAAGCVVVRLSGAGVPDLLVARAGALVALAEVKGKAGKLTPAQRKWREAWVGPKPVILRTLEDVEQLVRYGPAGLEG